MEYVELIGGIIVLIISGRLLVKGGVELASYLKISSLVIGMTVVAFGTSAPELLVSVSAALRGSPEIALGNVLGSNIANIALVLGVTALILPIPVQKDTVRYDWPIMMFSFIVLIVMMMGDRITRLEGVLLFTMLIIYIWWEIRHSRKQMKDKAEEIPKPTMPVWLAFVLIAISSVGLAKGADWLVDGAVKIAKDLGVSERVISITVVALGTSLPELTASVIAALKKQTDISVGNIIGSNIFNIFSIVGITAMIHPMTFNHVPFLFDMGALFVIGIMLWFFIFPFRSIYITRSEASVMLAFYIAYVVLLYTLKF